MAFVHRERRKVGEVTPTTSSSVGPGAYLALVSRAAAGHGYAPFSSTERRTLHNGTAGLGNPTPGPGTFDTATAKASFERGGGAGRFGLGGRGLDGSDNANVATPTPGPGQYAVRDAWHRKTNANSFQPQSVRLFDTGRTDTTTRHFDRGPDQHTQSGAYSDYSDDEELEQTRNIRGDADSPNKFEHRANSATPAKSFTKTKQTQKKCRAFFTAPPIDPESLSTDPFDPAPLAAVRSSATKTSYASPGPPSKAELLVEAIVRRHALVGGASRGADEALTPGKNDNVIPGAERLRGRTDTQRADKMRLVGSSWRATGGIFVGGHRRTSGVSKPAEEIGGVGFLGAADSGCETPRTERTEKSEKAPPFPKTKTNRVPFGVAQKMGHQSIVSVTPGPGCYAERPETFAEESRGGDARKEGAVAKKTKTHPTRSGAHPPLIKKNLSLSDDEELKLKNAKPKPEPFVSPGPGAYAVPCGVGTQRSQHCASFGVVDFGRVTRNVALRGNVVGPVVLREGRWVKATGVDEFGGGYDSNNQDSSPAAGATQDTQTTPRFVRAGGGFAHGIADAASDTVRAVARAAAAERKRAARVSPRAVSPVETFAPLPRSMSKVYDSRNDQIHDARRHAFAVSEVSKKKQQRELSERAFDGDAREVSARVTDRADARGKDATELPPLEKWNDFKMTQKYTHHPMNPPAPVRTTF